MELKLVDRFGGLVEFWFRGHTALVYAFLYLPIFVVVLFAFNDTERRVTTWAGFSLKWFEVALNDTVVQKAVQNSFWIALPNAFLAALFGTMAALLFSGEQDEPDRPPRLLAAPPARRATSQQPRGPRRSGRPGSRALRERTWIG